MLPAYLARQGCEMLDVRGWMLDVGGDYCFMVSLFHCYIVKLLKLLINQ